MLILLYTLLAEITAYVELTHIDTYIITITITHRTQEQISSTT